MKYLKPILTGFGYLLVASIVPMLGAQAPATASPDPSLVGRTFPAINYLHRGGATKVDFAGTSLLPGATGEAKVESKRGYLEIEVEFRGLRPARSLGSEYFTYVLWAITPQGRAQNLGELILRGDRSRVNVTTDLQAFGLIVTAEPYFAITQPSDMVALENAVRDDTKGRVEEAEARSELIRRGTYSVGEKTDELTARLMVVDPKVPLELYQARNAVRLIRGLGAERVAGDTFKKAVDLLLQAEKYQARKNPETKPATMMARQAVQAAEDARLITVQKLEEERLAAERRAAAAREAAAKSLAEAEAQRRAQAEVDMKSAQQAQRAAEQMKQQAEAARAEAEKAAAEAMRVRAAAEQAAAEAESARAAAQAAMEKTREEARVLAERTALEKAAAEKAAAEAESARAAAQADMEKTREEALVLAEKAAREKAAAEQARVEMKNIQDRAAAEQAKAEEARLAATTELERIRKQAEAEVAKLEAARAQALREKETAEGAAARARTDAEAANRAREQAERDRAALKQRLQEQLNRVLETTNSARGLIVNMSDVLFDTGKFSLRAGTREKLARVSGILSTQPGLRLEVEGHTDSVGGDQYNQKLSEQRANSVREYLIEQGIDASAVTAKGLGETRPKAGNETAEGRQSNRRVEVVVSGGVIGDAAADSPTAP